VEAEVSAAGGVLVRERDGRGEVAIVHRPKYDDWSLPKGKLDAGETWEAAAQREVVEETGFACRLVRDVGEVTYVDGRQRPKRVRYWLMELADGETGETFHPNAEVDDLAWLGASDAARRLTHDRDQVLLAAVGIDIR